MASKKKKILVITIPIIIVLIIGIILLILYLKTDFLKSDKTLFLKYISQNVDAIKSVMDDTGEKEYKNLLRQNKYESTAEVLATYTENINTSQESTRNDINKLKITSETKSDFMNNYIYKNIKLLYNDTNLLTTEYLHDGPTYGIRFPEEFSQFLAVENSDLKEIATNLGVTDEQIGIVPEDLTQIDINSLYIFTEEEIYALQSKYIELISNNITDSKYSRQKDALITIGADSMYTNAYSITLTQEETNEIYIKILEELRKDEIILNKIKKIEPYLNTFYSIKGEDNSIKLSEQYDNQIQSKIEEIQRTNIGTNQIKYTVYELNGKTIRTQILDGTNQTTLDFNITDEGVEIKINTEIANDEQENKQKIEIQKKHNNIENKFTINTEKTLGNIWSKTEFFRNINFHDENPSIEIGINYDDGKDNLLEIKCSEKVNLNQQFNKEVEATKANTVVINNYSSDQVKVWLNMVKDFLDKKMQENNSILTNITKVNVIRSNFWTTRA